MISFKHTNYLLPQVGCTGNTILDFPILNLIKLKSNTIFKCPPKYFYYYNITNTKLPSMFHRPNFFCVNANNYNFVSINFKSKSHSQAECNL